MFKIFSQKGGIDNISGFYSNGYSASLKSDNQKDIGFIYSECECDISALLTNNRFQAAPLKHYKKYIAGFKTNFILVNSKNANAMTMQEGIDDIDEILASFAHITKSNLINPIMSSTGVIGVRLPKDKIINSFKNFNLNSKNSDNFAQAIMTTDTYKKELSFKIVLDDGGEFNIAGIAKGAGMINPSMATMLCFITTDANIPKNDMDEILKEINEDTFNSISVDGDTSTNDTIFLLANKKSKHYNKKAFFIALKQLMQYLSIEILKDGEGSTKVVAYEITGAKNNKEAEIAAKALSNSLLIKTALFGQDPNWGRIAMGIGASGVECDESKLIIQFDDLTLYNQGSNLFTADVEKSALKIMSNSEFKIKCNLGIGSGKFTALGCDLSYEYIKINADYRT